MGKKKDSSRIIINIVKIIVFLLVVACLLLYLSHVFDMKDEKNAEQVFNTFYDEPENSLDGVYLGSSATYRYWMPTRAYEKTGICVYNLSTGSQPMVMQKYLIEEVLKTQPNTKVILIELRNIVKPDEGLLEADIRRVCDSMNYSKTRTKSIDAALAYYKKLGIDIDYNKAHYYYPFLKYHNRWDGDIDFGDLSGQEVGTLYKGFVLRGDCFSTLKMDVPTIYTGKQAVEKNRMEVLEDLLSYCKTLKQQVIFVASPYYTTQDKQERLNTVVAKCRSEGFTVWNFNQQPLRSQIQMNWQHDYFQTNHTNIYGAEKYTDFLAKKLDSKFHFKDHRNDPAYSSWAKAAKKLDKDIKERIKEQQEKEQNK